MRLELTLTPKNNNYTLPLNYQYYLYISFFIIFDNASEEFKNWAKEKSFTNRNDRFYLYNFSQLKFLNEKEIDIKSASISSSGDVKLIFSSPIFDKNIIKYIIELLNGNNIHFYPAKRENQEFTISDVKELNCEFENDQNNYRMMSPGCFFTKNYKHFFQIGDNNLEKNLIYDLKSKYELVYKKEYNEDISLKFDAEFIENKKISKLITMKENTPKEYKIRAFQCPFTLNASKEMQFIATTCGIAMKNKFGFGSIEVIESEVENESITNKNEAEKSGLLNKFKSLFKF